MNSFPTIKLSELPLDTMRRVVVEGRELCLYHLDDGVFATDNICTHQRASLAQGEIIDGCVECPRHGSRFDIRTGTVRALPAIQPLTTYPVTIEDDTLYVQLPD